ncbi:MAG: hypothetical protein AB8E15_02185 [Bdellovibrionales bacterium]
MRFDLDLEELLKDMDFREYEKDSLNNCMYCGTELNFKHKVSVKNQEVMEVSYCPECGLSGKKSSFKLQ